MRKTGVFNPPVSLAITDTPLLGSDPNRVAIILSGPPTNRYSINFGQPATLDQGLTMFPLSQPFLLTREDIGDLITLDIRGISAVAPQTVTVLVVTLAP